MQEGKTQEHYCSLHSGVIADMNTLKSSVKDQWSAIEKIQNRLPVWGTTIISILTFFLGIAVSFALKK
jgi:hypothetical protein